MYKRKVGKINEWITYIMINNKIFVVHFPDGSPAATSRLETLIALGVKNFIVIGTAGGIQTELIIGDVILSTKAIRDEGTSYHYTPVNVEAKPDKTLFNRLAELLEEGEITYKVGSTWTIDTPFRETQKEVETYSRNGVLTVEMELSAMFIVSKIRKTKLASVLVVSDKVNKKWKITGNFNIEKKMFKILDLVVKKLKM